MANNILLMEEDVMDKQIKYKDKDGNEKELTVGGALKQGEDHPAYDQAKQIADKEKGDDKKDDGDKLSGSDFDRGGEPEKKVSLGQKLKSKVKGLFKGKDSAKKSTKPGEAAKAVLDDPAKLKSMNSSEVKDVLMKHKTSMFKFQEKESEGYFPTGNGNEMFYSFEDEDLQEKWWESEDIKKSLMSTVKKKERSEASDKMETAAGKKYREIKEVTVKKHPLREMYERIGGK
jgi:hypothetical protein